MLEFVTPPAPPNPDPCFTRCLTPNPNDVSTPRRRSYGASLLVAEPPAAPAAPPPAPAHASGGSSTGPNGSSTTSYSVSSRDYAREMASLSVELDATIDEDDEHAGSGLEQAQVRPGGGGQMGA